MAEHERVMFILIPFGEEFGAVREALKQVAEMMGLTPRIADENRHQANLLEMIIDGIYESDLVVADLTNSNPNVLYELGVANALSRRYLMICQHQPGTEPKWVVEPEGGLGKLPFDLGHFRVVGYVNNPDGLKALQRELKESIQAKIEGGGFNRPVNAALNATLKWSRFLFHFFWGWLPEPLLASSLRFCPPGLVPL